MIPPQPSLSSACLRSAIRSASFSRPIDSRTVSGPTWAAAFSCSGNCRCVVEDGWIASDLISPMLTRWEISSSPAMKASAAGSPPFSAKVKIEPGPCGV